MFNKELKKRISNLEANADYVHGELVMMKAELSRIFFELGYEYRAEQIIPEQRITGGWVKKGKKEKK